MKPHKPQKPHDKKFSTLPLEPALISVVKELGFARLTPIQAQSIPVLLEGKDLIGQSKTGSGKTAAFALPILQKIHVERKMLQALVLCPTRELCTQVAREIRKFGRRHAGLQVLILSGGQPIRPQMAALEKGAHVVTGTPGRLIDHIRRSSLDLRQVKFVVLDEADRMLDMGFKDDIETILNSLPKLRQTAFFSATFPNSIEAMSKKYQKDPVKVVVKDDSEDKPDTDQTFYETHYEEKFHALLNLLHEKKPETSLVFCNQKVTVDELTNFLVEKGVSAACLHGDLEQSDRDRVMAKFRNQSIRVLIATDVAARGIDVENLDIVFNFDLPINPETYVHRIGRTGRAGRRGRALSLVMPREWKRVDAIEKFTGVKAKARIVDGIRPPLKKVIPQDSKMETLYISGGRKDKVRPGDILGALTGEAGKLDAADIGKIEIHDHFAYVAVTKKIASLALERLNQGKIKGRKFHVKMVR